MVQAQKTEKFCVKLLDSDFFMCYIDGNKERYIYGFISFFQL